jgi:hypothetical protein
MPPTKRRKTRSSRRRRIKNKSVRRKIRGGNYVTSGLSPYTTYDQNTYGGDPSRPELGSISARNIGGGRRKYKKRTMRGGIGQALGAGSPIDSNPAFFDINVASNLLKGAGIGVSSALTDNNNVVPTFV